MHTLTDRESELARLIADGDTVAFRQLYDLYYPGVFRFATRFLEDRQAAEDITTESFIWLWTSRAELPAIRSISSFLFTAVRNACLNYIRDHKRHAAHHSLLQAQTAEAIHPHEVTTEAFRLLEAEISKLTAQQCAVLRLYLEGRKPVEISEQLGIAEKTVRNLKSDAVKALRISLGGKELLTLFLLYIYHR